MLRTADDDMGQSKQPTLTPIFRKVAPLLVRQFQKGMKSLPAAVRKKAIKTAFKDVKLGGDPAAKKNHKMLRDILVKSLVRDRGWLEFVAEQILDGSEAELREVLAPTKTATTTAAYGDLASLSNALTRLTTAHYVSEAKDGFEKVADTAQTAMRGAADTHSVFGLRVILDACREGLTACGQVNPDARRHRNESLPTDVTRAIKKVKSAFTSLQMRDASAMGDTMRTAGVIDGIYEGKYPSSESDFDGVDFPISFDVMGQSDSWYRLESVAREHSYMAGNAIYLENVDAAIGLFSALDAEKDDHEAEVDSQMQIDFEEASEHDTDVEDDGSWFDTNYSEYHADDNEPAAILAEQLGLS